MRKSGLMFMLLLTCSLLFSQQTGTFADYLPLARQNNGDLLFNKTAVNPSFSDPSVRWSGQVQFQEQWLGFSGSPTEQNAFFQWNIPETGHTAGIELERWGNADLRNRMVRFSYSYRHTLTEQSGLAAGLSLDLTSLKPDSLLTTFLRDPRNSYFIPNLHAGVSYRLRSMQFGISYGGIRSYSLEGIRQEYPVNLHELILSYTSLTTLGAVLSLNSDVVIMTDLGQLDYYLATRFIFKEKFSGGVYFNSVHNSKGLVLSFQGFKKLEIAYQFYFNVIGEQILGGHSFLIRYELPVPE
ncbi:MAG: type IX secretion system membrane protein PorP/SprF [Bacteroidales bacterium]|nr:type IX secretion system membrane protein PorP/SprF [Bacteroidales bacterium]